VPGPRKPAARSSSGRAARRPLPQTSVDSAPGGAGGGLIAGIQRARILAAIAAIACERGAGRATVSEVVARAGVSRRTFYELYEDLEACLLAAVEDALDCAQAYVRAGHDPGAPWRVRVRAGLAGLLSFLEDEPLRGRLVVVESLGLGPRALSRRAAALEPAIAAVDAGRAEARAPAGLSPLTAEGAVGAVLAILHTRLLAAASAPGRAGRGAGGRGEGAAPVLARANEPGRAGGGALLALCPQLASLLVRPYLGAAAARAELERTPPPPVRPAPLAAPADAPLGRLPLRLTARTLGVLAEIGARPGCSNRHIGLRVGVADQGQMSKLLQRLHRHGLIANEVPTRPGGPSRGAPNAWVLTARGAQLGAALPRTAPRRP
jgi:AcrR family transcriptional regulator